MNKRFFRSVLESSKIPLDKVYYTNLVKCNTDKIKKQNIVDCSEYLLDEITTVNPKKIITLGKDSTTFFIPRLRYASIKDYIGKKYDTEFGAVFPLYSVKYIMNLGKKDVESFIQLLQRIYNGI